MRMPTAETLCRRFPMSSTTPSRPAAACPGGQDWCISTATGSAAGSCSTVRDYVAFRRPLIKDEARSLPTSLPGCLQRHNAPDRNAEVDFGELYVRLDGQLTKCQLFVLRLALQAVTLHRAPSFRDVLHPPEATLSGWSSTGSQSWRNWSNSWGLA